MEGGKQGGKGEVECERRVEGREGVREGKRHARTLDLCPALEGGRGLGRW